MERNSALHSAIDRARELTRNYKTPGHSVDIVELARALGVRAVEAADMLADGYLGRRLDGALVIRYRAQNHVARNRFTIAHEVGHLLLAESEGKSISHPSARYERRVEEETAVNRIAAELLMPVAGVTRALQQRARDGQLPSWRIIGAIGRDYGVSTSAMAFRLLELPEVDAISLRITIDGGGPKFPFDRSENSTIRLANGVEFEMERLWRDARKSTRHEVSVTIDGELIELSCEGSVRSINRRAITARHYWVIGWRLAPRRMKSYRVLNECQ